MTIIDEITQGGKQVALADLFIKYNLDVCIPIIQRDYAQGRKTASDIRESFLSALHHHLVHDICIDLDFVYGTISTTTVQNFIPLDGQQRLTTLFLLHYYLALKEDKQWDLYSSVFSRDKHSRFSYETRASAKEFCDALLNHGKQLSITSEMKISVTIADQHWFFNGWKRDPTIQSMLVMLDDIHSLFFNTDKLYEKLTRPEKPVITFQLLNLTHLGLTDELYIKMNSRGKQLTPFESFKAKFEQVLKSLSSKKSYVIKSDNETREYTLKEYFSHKIDTEWADLFWSFRNHTSQDENFDDELMNFFRVLITNHYAVLDSGDKPKYIQILRGGRGSSKEHLPFMFYEKLGCFNLEFATRLMSFLDTIITYSDSHIAELNVFNNQLFYYNEIESFNKVMKNDLTYAQALRFFAYFMFITDETNVHKIDNEKTEQWMRVVFNLTENQFYDKADSFIDSIMEIQMLASYSNDIYTYLSNETNTIKSFTRLQVLEERIKAILISKGADWKQTIYEAEQHGYFAGQIGFLLKFSGIEDAYESDKKLNWNEKENTEFLLSFNRYKEKAFSVFVPKGIKPELEDDTYLWHRALLTDNDYLISAGKFWSFVVNNHRDYSWKRILRSSDRNEEDKKYANSQRDIIKRLFDNTDFDLQNPIESCKDIINSYNGTDWRKPFILYPEMIGCLGKDYRLIQWSDEAEAPVYLLQQTVLGKNRGKYAEFNSYCFFQEYLKNKEFKPFTNIKYHYASGLDNKSCAYLDGFYVNKDHYALDIGYDLEKKNWFLCLFIRTDNIGKNLTEKLLEKLKSEHFDVSDIKNPIAICVNENDTINKLQVTCDILTNFATENEATGA